MTHKLNGGLAYPMPASEGYHSQQSGMTLRDYFAGQALVGLMSQPGDHWGLQDIVDAYQIADAMIKERDVK